MRVVVVAPALPLPFGRADARWLFSLVTELAARGVEVQCISSTEEDEAAVRVATTDAEARGFDLVHVPIHVDANVVRRKLMSARRPFSEMARSRRLRALLEAQARRGYDVLQAEQLFTAWAVLGLPRVVNYVHCLEVCDWSGRTDLTLRERVNLIQMRRATRRLLRRTDRTLACSAPLAESISRYTDGRTPPVVPLAIDTSLYPVLTAVDAPVIGLIGSMDWYPSRSAAVRLVTRIWPGVRARIPHAKLLIAGWNSERYLADLFPVEGAELIGAIPHPADFFARIAMLVFPATRGTGMKVKVMEALAYGVPVVTNDVGFEGLDVGAVRADCSAQTDEEFVAAIVRLLTDPKARQALRRRGRRILQSSYSPAPVIDQLIEAYRGFGLLT